MIDDVLIAAIRDAIEVPKELGKQAMEALRQKYPDGGEPIEEHANDDFGRAYNAAAEALAKVAIMAFEHAARELSVSGAQAGWAAGEILRKLQGINGPMAIVEVERLLYPQYDGRLGQFLDSEENRAWLQERAQEKLAEGGRLGDAVRERLTLLAERPEDWRPNP